MRSGRVVTSVLFVFLFIALPTWARIGWPDPDLSIAWLSYEGPEPLTLMITPDGTGGYFSQARTPEGASANATITLLLLDAGGVPVTNFPSEDIWVQAEDEGIAICGNFGLWPDTDTDQDGQTQWFQRPRGGGYSEGPLIVYFVATPLSGPPLELYFNSPDINCDRTVNLSDVGWFALDFFGAYHFRSDLHRDGVINLSDVSPLAEWMGRSCTH